MSYESLPEGPNKGNLIWMQGTTQALKEKELEKGQHCWLRRWPAAKIQTAGANVCGPQDTGVSPWATKGGHRAWGSEHWHKPQTCHVQVPPSCKSGPARLCHVVNEPCKLSLQSHLSVFLSVSQRMQVFRVSIVRLIFFFQDSCPFSSPYFHFYPSNF